MVIEVEFEKGCLSVEDYIREEANELVKNELGKSKRLIDSKENILEKMKDLLSLRMQVAKNIWQRQLNEFKIELKQKIQSNEKIEKKIQQLANQIRNYMRLNKIQSPELNGKFEKITN